MRIMMIGDVVGRPGREAVRHHLPRLREELGIDLVVANGENIAHGYGLTQATVNELLKAGVDVLTGGNHTWDKKEIFDILKTTPQVLRPLNYPAGVPGCGTWCDAARGLAVISLMGQGDMPPVDNPFNTLAGEIGRLRDAGITTILIDFHAEYTAEKRALCKAFAGQASVIVGTHTHVGTDDLTIDCGTAYVTDIGLTGCRDNVIGMGAEEPIIRMTTGLPARLSVPDSCPAILQAIVVELEEGRAVHALKVKVADAVTTMTQEVADDRC